jgi:hypothetical protein
VRLGAHKPESTVVVVCRDDSLHARLVKVLDLCAKAGLENVAIMSSGPRP